jgi:mono/diheme cytochrome c family protein
VRRHLQFASTALLAMLAGCKVSPPGALERTVAASVKRRITVGGKDDVNPLPATAENIRAGQKAFSHYCLVCHGLDGQNTGVPFADRMSPPVPPLNSAEVQAYRDGQLRWIIQNGIYPSGMPASKGILNDDEIWSIVDYIRHLPPKGSLGEPPVYTGELEELGRGATSAFLHSASMKWQDTTWRHQKQEQNVKGELQ